MTIIALFVCFILIFKKILAFFMTSPFPYIACLNIQETPVIANNSTTY